MPAPSPLPWRANIEELTENVGNFSQPFRWKVEIPVLPYAVVNGGYGLNANDVTQGINFRAESFTLPEKDIETTEITIKGQKLHQHGIATYNSPLTLTINETIDAFTFTMIGHLQEIAWESSHGGRGRTAYKKDCIFNMYMYLLDPTDRPYYVYLLKHCQVANVTRGDADSSTADPFKPALSIAYEYFLQGQTDTSGNASNVTGTDDDYIKDNYFTGANYYR